MKRSYHRALSSIDHHVCMRIARLNEDYTCDDLTHFICTYACMHVLLAAHVPSFKAKAAYIITLLLILKTRSRDWFFFFFLDKLTPIMIKVFAMGGEEKKNTFSLSSHDESSREIKSIAYEFIIYSSLQRSIQRRFSIYVRSTTQN